MPVTTHVISLGSLTAQCRQQVNTPCRRRLQSDALMSVKRTLLVLLASTKRTRLPGRDPAGWQCSAARQTAAPQQWATTHAGGNADTTKGKP